MARSHTVWVELTVKIGNELKKPDLVMKGYERLYVVDVTIRYEDRNNLRNAFKEKANKYKKTAEVLRQKLKCQTAKIIPIIGGSRGTMSMQTQANMKKLGCNKSKIMTASLIALRPSIKIANEFIDYDKII